MKSSKIQINLINYIIKLKINLINSCKKAAYYIFIIIIVIINYYNKI